MLKEARIVMPKVEDGAQYHIELQRQLVRAFGGYTTFHGNGGWFSEAQQRVVDDAVAIYDVALEAERDASWDKLFLIAMEAGRALGQKAVYIRYPDGHVEITSIDAYAENGIKRDASTKGVVDSLASFEPPLGTKRLPSPGEVWRNRNGALVAVMSAASILDGGYNVVTLTKSESARNPGHVYTVNLDGVIFTRLREAGGDLISYVTRFDS